MTRGWECVIAVSSVTMLCKAAGRMWPAVAHAERGRGTWLRKKTDALLPATLAALMTKELFTLGHSISVDARTAGVAVAIVVTSLRGSPVVAIGAAVVTTALLRR